MSTIALLTIGFVVLLAIMGLPIWMAILGGIMPYFLIYQTMLAPQIIAQRVVAIAENSAYMAIPFFVAMGAVMNYAGISKRLLDLADGLVGHKPGGLGYVNVILSTLMGGCSGSSAADASMEAKILVPEMTARGYDKDFSAAITISSSLITTIIPPGMGLILFGFVTNTSIGRLFCAGYLPGLLMMASQLLYVYLVSKKRGYKSGRESAASGKEVVRLMGKALWGLVLPFGIILGIRIGIFTATEAGALSVIYALIIGVLVYRDFKFKKHFKPALLETVYGTATVMILVCVANGLSYFMTYENIVNQFTTWLLGLNLGRSGFLFVVNIILLFLGMFIEGGPMFIILAPMLTPIASELGIDPVHFGLIFTMLVSLGNMTPPFGIVLYQVAGIVRMDLVTVSKAVLPLVLIQIGVIILCDLFPFLSLAIPDLIYG